MKSLYTEVGRTVRAAIKGWHPTLRLVVLMVVAAAIWIGVELVVR